MRLPWKDYLAMHWPYLVAIGLGAISLFYTTVYRQGQMSILRASEQAYKAAKEGGLGAPSP